MNRTDRARLRATRVWVNVRAGALAALLVVLAAACTTGGNGGSGNATATPTVTGSALPSPTVTPTGTASQSPTATGTGTPPRTPTPTSTADGALVSGLVVVSQDVGARPGDVLGTPPEDWLKEGNNASFDRALGYADWTLDGGAQRGVTGPDGRFAISGLEPGAHALQVTTTLDGNLVLFTVPFTVGDDGRSEVVAEVKWGLVRAMSTYSAAGVTVREISGPYGNRVTIRDGKVSELSDGARTLSDPEGDGTFVAEPCVDAPCTVEIVTLQISGPTQLIVGQQGSNVFATAVLSDGGRIDVTQLVTWASADATILTVDSWGLLTALAAGSTTVTATLGDLTSAAWPITVTPRPPLRRILVQNVNCYCGPTFLGRAEADGSPFIPCLFDAPPQADLLPVPICRQVVRIGGTIQFSAIGEFGDAAYYEDLTQQVAWQVTPPEIGEVTAGLFTAVQEGSGQITASLEGVTSEPVAVRVVTQPTVVSLSIYPRDWVYATLDGGPLPADQTVAEPCFDCGYTLTVLKEDKIGFAATAQYDTGDWEDVTSRVTWRTSDPTVATIDGSGLMTAVAAGGARIDATLDAVTSNPVDVRVVNEATLQNLSIYMEGTDRVLAKGGQAFFHAAASYDVGVQRDVTDTVTWRHRCVVGGSGECNADEDIGRFDAPGVFTGLAAGTVEVWAEIDGQESNRLVFEVYETSELDYCDPNAINRGVWSDAFNRVVLESDCAEYSQPGFATFRYTVTETQPHGGIFDPCLDLYVYRGDDRVRTLREEGCGDPFLARGAPEFDAAVLKYQLRASWNLKGEDGQPVPPGTYRIYGRFYLYYDPVVSIDVTVH